MLAFEILERPTHLCSASTSGTCRDGTANEWNTVEPYFVQLDSVSPGGGSRNYPQSLSDSYRVQELVGHGRAGSATLDCDQVRVGMLSLPAGFAYPFHHHPAPEIYVLIGGRVEWQVGDDPSRVLEPITAIFHEPGVSHRMTNVGSVEAQMLYYWWAPNGDTSVLTQDAVLDEQS